jgi:hypothetical protein
MKACPGQSDQEVGHQAEDWNSKQFVGRNTTYPEVLGLEEDLEDEMHCFLVVSGTS